MAYILVKYNARYKCRIFQLSARDCCWKRASAKVGEEVANKCSGLIHIGAALPFTLQYGRISRPSPFLLQHFVERVINLVDTHLSNVGPYTSSFILSYVSRVGLSVLISFLTSCCHYQTAICFLDRLCIFFRPMKLYLGHLLEGPPC